MPARKRTTKKTTATKTSKRSTPKKKTVVKKTKVAKPKKVTKKKPTPKKKTSKKPVKTKTPKKVTRKKATKKIEVEIKENTEPLSFGLSEKEITSILKQEIKTAEQLNDEKRHQELVKELASLIPHDEPIVTSKNPKTHNLIIKNVRERHEHSPFVIDLKKLAKKKEELAMKQAFVNHRYNELAGRVKKVKKVVTTPVKITPTPKQKIVNQHIHIEKNNNKLLISTEEIKSQFTRKPVFRLPLYWYRTAIIFAIFALIVIAPIKGFTYFKDLTDSKDQIITSSQQAINNIKSAGVAISNADTDTAGLKFQEAKMNFENTNKEISSINTFISAAIKVIPFTGKYLSDAERLTAVGEKTADLGQDLTEIFANFYNNETLSLTEKINLLQKQTNESLLPQIESINNLLIKVDAKILPSDKINTFDNARLTLQQIEQDLRELTDFSDYLLEILGHEYKRKYLIVFQNNNEIRATGGFMGSLAIVEIHNGKVENIDIPGGGTYDFQGGQMAQVISPDPLHLINSKWELQDANWFFDFPTSAKKIEWFYENAANESVDGVITINASLIEKILAHTDPISMPEYGKTINASNFITETQMQVEYQYDTEENKPKQFISDLTPILIEQIFNPEKTDLMGIVNELKTGLETKDIQMYFNNSLIQNKISDYDWSGELKNTSLDYLAVANTNIAGGKTDSYINQNIDHQVNIEADGSITDTVTISRTHTGSLDDIFSGVRNVNYQRIYVPQGSTLLEVSGFNPPPLELFEVPEDYLKPDKTLQETEQNKTIEPQSQTVIYNTANKTVFAGWTQTDPGKTTQVILKYKLPFKFQKPEQGLIASLVDNKNESKLFTIFYQKQSGQNNTEINSSVNLPQNMKAIWDYPNNGLNITTNKKLDLNKDKIHGIIIQAD